MIIIISIALQIMNNTLISI